MTWSEQFADFLLTSFHGEIPDDVVERAGLALLDAVACAAGADDATPVGVVHRTIAGSGPAAATLFFRGTRVSVVDAVLANGTAVRYLDANDVFLGTGPGGHPSDNIPVALAVGEEAGASGRAVLGAIAVGYEIVARVRRFIFRHVPQGPRWHEVSISGTVAAAVCALLKGADRRQLTNAIAIGAAKGYALREMRRGDISMLKACGNALVAREGVMAAMLALNGMSGPPRVFEGDTGLVATLGGEPDVGMVQQLCAPADWAIRQVSVKPYPALGTSQAAVHAATMLAEAAGGLEASVVAKVVVRLPDTPWTRDYMLLPERTAPQTRETADHSIQFLVAVALLEGELTQEHYERELWKQDRVRTLIDRTVIEPDLRLTSQATTAFPAVVEITLHDGRTLRQEVTRPPGSPGNPWGRDEIVAKFIRLDRVGLSASRIDEIGDAALGLHRAPNVDALAGLLRAATP